MLKILVYALQGRPDTSGLLYTNDLRVMQQFFSNFFKTPLLGWERREESKIHCEQHPHPIPLKTMELVIADNLKNENFYSSTAKKVCPDRMPEM